MEMSRGLRICRVRSSSPQGGGHFPRPPDVGPFSSYKLEVRRAINFYAGSSLYTLIGSIIRSHSYSVISSITK